MVKCANHYYGLSITELKQLAYQFAIKMNVAHPSSWDVNFMAGEDWYYGYMKRHRRLSLRTPEQTSLNRVKSFCRENVQHFMGNLDAVMTEYNFEPKNIWNMDETGFSTVPDKVGKVISLRGIKRCGQIAAAERGKMITMALAVNAAGNSIPPFFLFPGKNMQSVNMDNRSPGAVGFANESGWMKQADFVNYMRHFIQYSHSSLENPTLLLIDNHSSHLSVEALDLATENGITLLSFPPHCSHKLQPLDVSVYGPVKTYYAQDVDDWQKNHKLEQLQIRHIVGLVSKTLDKALTPLNIKSGFRATGICPYNSSIFTDADFMQADLSGENQAAILPEPSNVEDQRSIVIGDTPEVGAETEISTSEATTSDATESPTVSRSSSMSSVLDEVGPLQSSTSKTPRSKRGRPSMKSTILTSPENMSNLKEKRAKRDAAEKKKADKKTKDKATKKTPPAKRAKKKKSLSSDEDDFCLICFLQITERRDIIKCKSCPNEVHKKCAKLYAGAFTCEQCVPDDEPDDEFEESDE